jgi:hypothetical protein
MLDFIVPALLFLFLVVGAVVFLVCILIAPLRRFALSAALWCAMWGPCSAAFLLLAGTAFLAEASISTNGDMQIMHMPRLLAVLGWGYLTLAVLGTTVIATGVAWLHQVLVHRLTFLLFRLYATVVCAGIGSVFGWCIAWTLLENEVNHTLPLSILGMLVLTVSFGTAAYKAARSLRGKPAKTFTWITAEEFHGT